MGYTLPGWADEILEFIGIGFPNVDEDDYTEMADALREFADRFESHGGDAHQAISRVLASGEGWAVDALQEHWGKVKSSHLDQVPEVARLFATACDTVAGIIFGLKRKAEIELGYMAASLGISIGLAFVTGGLSALIGAGQAAAMREVVRRLIREAQQEIVDRLIAEVTEPVTNKLTAMTEDMILDITEDAIALPAGAGGDSGDSGGGGHGPGVSGMNLNSAGGPAGGGGGKVRIDTDEFDNGAEKMSRHGQDLDTNAASSLRRAQNAFGRTKGRDPFTQVFESVLEGALSGTQKAVTKIARHVKDGVPNGIRAMSRNHKRNEQSIVDSLKAIDSKGGGTGPNGGRAGTGAKRWGRAGEKIRLAATRLAELARAARCKLFGGDPIDMASGEMFQSQTDLVLPGVLPLTIERTHISSYRQGRFFGPSWTSTVDERLERGDGGIWWRRTDGSSLMYPRAPDMLGDEVLPLEGERIPLTCVMEGTEYALAVTEPRSGLTRHFREAPESGPDVWWLTEIADRNGNGISIDRDGDGTPTAVRHDAGYHVEVTCDAGLVAALDLRTPDGPTRVVAYRYDDDRNLTGVVNSSGLPLRFGYDDQHRITSWTDRNDSTFQYVYDDGGRVVRTVGPDGCLSSRLEYDADERTTRYTDSLGAVTVYRTNERGQVIAETDPLGHTVHSEWDRHDNLVSRTDALGHTTTFTYDDPGNLVAVERPDGTRITTDYNRLHLPTQITAPDGAVWRQEFDRRGNRTAVVTPDGATTRFTHDPTGSVTTITDPAGAQTRIANNPAGLPLTLTDPLGAETTCSRDAFGRPAAVTDATGATTRMEWTIEGKPARRTAPDGHEETWTWDGEGNCLTHTDPGGGSSTFTHTHFDQLATRTTPDGATHAFTYDTELRLTQVTNPYGLTWDYTYDRAGNLVAECDFDNREITYTHDAAGRLVGRTTPAGHTFTYAHDAIGRTVTKTVGDTETHYTYDNAGHLLRAASPTSTLDLAYDPVGRLVAETVDGRTTRYTYDRLGRRTTRTTPTGAVSTSTYDQAGNRTSLSADGHTLHFTHDVLGRETERTYGDTVALHSAWDPLGRLVQQDLVTNTRTQRARRYAYRPDSYLTSVTDEVTGTAQHMDLDPVGRPLTVTAEGWSETYAYDQAGNQTEAHWPDRAGKVSARGDRTYEGTRILTAGSIRYEHDAAGRMTLRRKNRLSRKPDTWHYEWDAEDRLTACVTPDGTRWTYTYDPLGRRTAKHRLGAGGEPAETVYFTWDGTRLAEQYDNATGVTLTWDHEGHRPLTQYERKHLAQDQIDSRFFAIVTDLVGTPTELVDETGGIAWHTRSTLWGTTTWNTDATAYTPLRFPGQYADPETGLHYNYFRHYDPDTARYVTSDPLGLRPAPNPISYVLNPFRWRDPLGLFGCEEEDDEYSSRWEPARDLARYAEGQSTRDPSSQWYHEFLTNDELMASINDAAPGDGFLVSNGGQILGGHHRWDELMARVGDGRIDPETPTRVDVYGGD